MTEASSGREILVSLSSPHKLIAGWDFLSFASPLGEVVQTEYIIFKLPSNLNWKPFMLISFHARAVSSPLCLAL